MTTSKDSWAQGSSSTTRTSKTPAAAARPSPSENRRARASATKTTTELLVGALGRDRVLCVGDDEWHDYTRDASGVTGEPDAVARPATRDEVAEVLRLAAEHSIPIVPRGAGSGKVGGCVATRGGIILSCERLDKIIEVDASNMIAIVESGAVTARIDEAAADIGLYYPPDPASMGYSTIGGNVATNAGGPSSFKYGVTGDYVRALNTLLIGGSEARLGHTTQKGSSGHGLFSAFIGSEGTLGIVTEIALRLIPRPPSRGTLLGLFDSTADAGRAITAVVTSGVWPKTIELLDTPTLAIVRDRCSRAIPSGAGAALLVELDGDVLDSTLARAGDALAASGAIEVAAAIGDADSRPLWQARREVSQALKEAFPYKVSDDVCVPRGRVPDLIARIASIGGELGLVTAAYGHAGDGNLHVNFLFDTPIEGELAAALATGRRRLFQTAIDLGGTLSGEHGIGITKRPFVDIEHNAASLAWHRRLKEMWDPRGLLNPGKGVI